MVIEQLVIQIVRQRPTQLRGRGLLQIPMNGRLSDRATAGDLVLVQPQAKPQAENFLYFSHRQLSLGQSAPSTLEWRRLSPAVVQRRLAYMKFSSENHSGDGNIDSGPASFLHPFQPGIHIHIASESIFTSLRNDYSHAPESAASRLRQSYGGFRVLGRRLVGYLKGWFDAARPH